MTSKYNNTNTGKKLVTIGRSESSKYFDKYPEKKEEKNRKNRLLNKTPEYRERKYKRTKARRKLEKEGRVKKYDRKDIDHKRPLKNGGGNGRGNLRVMHMSANRARKKAY